VTNLSGDNLGEVLLPHFFACLPDRGKDVFRGDEAPVKLDVKESGAVVEFHPGDPGDVANFGAHGVGAAGSQVAALVFHTLNLQNYFSPDILFHLLRSLPLYFIIDYDIFGRPGVPRWSISAWTDGRGWPKL
jgi:hypothetical protein